ncbi:MAG: fibronectin type III domain-containing protein [Candidatus Peribacteraceae bacterium]|nr:fibronectin type III domain-containing protein [Candidatus Peribacteraceae bacterium]MDD5739806.1 fibronectin type III domain-containing protein [Candidatus Peribacteraceae bacterium]
MTLSTTLRRLALSKILLLPMLALVILIPANFMAEETAEPTLFLRPHCAEGTATCPTYTVKDPETLQTSPQKKGDELHMDLVLTNPGKRKISRVRAWLQYNSAVLEGKGITAGTALPTPTPGEMIFSATDGLIKIDLSATANAEPTTEEILIARLLLQVKSVPQTKTDVMSFYDVQPTGHTRVVAVKTAGGTEDILTQNPGSLLVAFEAAPASSASSVASSTASTGSGASSASKKSGSGTSFASDSGSGSSLSSVAGHAAGSGSSAVSSVQSSASSAAAPICGNGIVEAGEQCDDGNFLAGDGCSIVCTTEAQSSSSTMIGSGASSASSVASRILLPDGMTCSEHGDCKGGLCSGGICRGDILKVEDGGACTAPGHCMSGICESNRCAKVTSSSSASVTPPVSGTAFALLQVRNVRITTEGTSLYVAWDPLASSQLKAYNLYYGTTTGRYIQRKTISEDSTSMAIRGLPEKTTYFVAIRALSTQDEESAFSQEVAVEVGNAKTSTAPLTGDLLSTRKPVTVPGETGMSSVITLILTISAITGTALASRRQIVALTTTPRAR